MRPEVPRSPAAQLPSFTLVIGCHWHISRNIHLTNQSSIPKLWEKIAELYSFQIKMCFVSSQTWQMSCCSIQSDYQNESTSQLNPCVANKLWHYDIYVSLWLSFSNSSSKKCQWPIYQEIAKAQYIGETFWSKTDVFKKNGKESTFSLLDGQIGLSKMTIWCSRTIVGVE